MNKSIILILGLCLLISGCAQPQSPLGYATPTPATAKVIDVNVSPIPKNDQQHFTVANWNLQIFGDKKASNQEMMNRYVTTISKYDIVFVQEIRDIDSSSFEALCNLLPDYNCEISSRAGRTSSKEQYGIFFKKNIHMDKMVDFNDAFQDRWQRPPILVVFNINNKTYNIYNIHTDPDNVSSELSALQDIASTTNTIILGDLNADCDYYNHHRETQFKDWTWVINDTDDTTVSATNCAYDRIILSKDLKYVVSGIYTDFASDLSDHYLIWIEI